MNTERLPITFVTSKDGNNKADIFQAWLPHYKITRRDPFYNEFQIHDRAPHNEHRPQIIAEHKAKDDAMLVQAMSLIADQIVADGDLYTFGNEKMLLYTDTVQLVHMGDGHISMLEKPVGDPLTWAKYSPEAMIQSGKDVEIVNALTGIQVGKDGVGEPKTVMLRVRYTAKPFTREEIIAYAKDPKNTIAHTSGGLSLSNGARHFYDMSKPMTISIADTMDETPTEIMRYDTWEHLTSKELKPLICGAVEPAVVRLVNKTNASR